MHDTHAMRYEIIIRVSLAIAAPANIAAAFLFAFPEITAGSLVELPTASHPLYAWICASLVGLFGLAYAWMAWTGQMVRALLLLAALGKLSAGAAAITLGAIGALSTGASFVIAGDIVFALLWLHYLVRGKWGGSPDSAP